MRMRHPTQKSQKSGSLVEAWLTWTWAFAGMPIIPIEQISGIECAGPHSQWPRLLGTMHHQPLRASQVPPPPSSCRGLPPLFWGQGRDGMRLLGLRSKRPSTYEWRRIGPYTRSSVEKNPETSANPHMWVYNVDSRSSRDFYFVASCLRSCSTSSICIYRYQAKLKDCV